MLQFQHLTFIPTVTGANTAMNLSTIRDDQPPTVGRRPRERGQVAVIFAGAMLLFVLLAATVIDLSWYWTNNLRMQRAADAAALAGVVFLPSQVGQAVTTARAEAAKNGYTHGVGGVVVTPVQDPSNNRRLLVTIRGPVGTYFARAVGITSWNAQRTSKADYVLPVPMGSPQHYYGVGFYQGRQATNNNIANNTDWNTTAQSVSGGQWSNPDRAFSNNDSYTTEDANNHTQIWGNFNLDTEIPNDATLVIDGLEVRLQDVRLTGSGTSTNCRVQVAVRKTSSGAWSANVPTPALTTSDTDPVQGSNSSLALWTPHTTWTRSDFANGAFQVRLTWNDNVAGCASNRNVQLDQLEVRVQYHTVTTTFSDVTLSVNDPATGTALASQGFWGAVFTSGGIRENGDRHAPSFLGNGTGAPAKSANPNYDAGGYDYLVELPGGSGQVRVFDPIYCATGPNPTRRLVRCRRPLDRHAERPGRRTGRRHVPPLQHQRHPVQHGRRRRPRRHADVRSGQRDPRRLQWQLRDAVEPGRRQRPELRHASRPQPVGADRRAAPCLAAPTG